MEKTINIDGRPVRLKSTGATVLRYKQQFGQDYFSELLKLVKIAEPLGTLESGELDLSSMRTEDLALFDLEVFYNFVWVLAKTADKSIPEPIEWLEEFESFPIMEILPEIMDLLSASIQTKKK